MSNDTQPEIRFPGFTEDWEERKLIDLVVRLNKSTNSSRLPKVEFEDIVAGEGRLNKDVSQKFDNRKGIEFLPNDILYGKLRPYLKNWFKATFTGVALGDFWVFRAKKSDSDFIYSLIQADRYQKAANDTSGTKMPRSDWKKVSGTVFYIPNDLKEQQKIGTFFKQLDDTIALDQRKLDLLKETKKGFLQKMFPKNGAKVPEIRFPGFTEDWEQCKLGDIAKMYQPPTISGSELLDTGYPVFGANGYIGFYSKSNHLEDQVTISARGEGTGTPSYVKAPVWITGNSMVINVEDFDINKKFLYAMLLSYSLKKYITGGAQPQLTRDVLLKVPIIIPSYNEQFKIGTFFKQLDDTIALQQRKLDLLKETKKGFLQKMFV